MRANEAIEKLVKDYEFTTILDVGSNKGEHAEYLRSKGKTVSTLDISQTMSSDYKGDYLDTELPTKFDAIWCSHVLEHVQNPIAFLAKTRRDLVTNGILAVTVPPLKSCIVSGHINLYYTGLLLYQLVLAGYDCKNAAVKKYGYNISVIVRNTDTNHTKIRLLEKLAHLFPIEVTQKGFEGDIEKVNW